MIKFLIDILRQNGNDLNYNSKCPNCSSNNVRYFSYGHLALFCKNCVGVYDTVALLDDGEISVLNKISSNELENLCGFNISEKDFVGVMRHLYILLANLLKFKSKAIPEYMKLFKNL